MPRILRCVCAAFVALAMIPCTGEVALAKDSIIAGAAPVCSGDPVMPGDPPGTACDDSIPTIQSSGMFPFSLTGEMHHYDIPCSLPFPGKRDVVFGLCLSRRTRLTLLVTPNLPDQVMRVAIARDCANPLQSRECPSPSQGGPYGFTELDLDAGTYFIIIEGYQDGEGVLSVDVQRSSILRRAASCADTEALLAADGPLDLEAYSFGRFLEGTPETVPSCGSGPQGIAPFQISSPMIAILAHGGGGGIIGSAFGLRPQCDDSRTDLACTCLCGRVGFARVLEAGVYFVPLSGSASPQIYLLPVPSTKPANTSCETARPLPMGEVLDEDYSSTDVTRYYTVTTTQTGLLLTTYLRNPGISGIPFLFAGSLYGTCDDPSTRIGDITFATYGLSGYLEVRGLPPGTYSVRIPTPFGAMISVQARSSY